MRMRQDQRWIRLYAEALTVGLPASDAREWADDEYRKRWAS